MSSASLASAKAKRSLNQPSNSQIPNQPINKQGFHPPFPPSQNQQLRQQYGGNYPPQINNNPYAQQQQQPMPQQPVQHTALNARGQPVPIPAGYGTAQDVFTALTQRIVALETDLKELKERPEPEVQQPSNEQMDFIMSELGSLREITLNSQSFILSVVQQLLTKQGIIDQQQEPTA
jgi:hypothetical protein